jgi:hypothetical protein
MPRSPLVLFLVATLVGLSALLSVGASSAEAATPCWKRALDDWSDNGRMDDLYSQACLQAAIDHLPEDLRIYSNAPEIISGARLTSARDRSLQGITGQPQAPKAKPGKVTPVEPETGTGTGTETGPKDEGPIQEVLNAGPTDASSIPLPLMLLAGLALALMAAGGFGFAHRKLAARRIPPGDS